MKRNQRRVALVLAFILLLTGVALLVYSYAAGPSPTQSLSFSIDWPLPNGPLANALTYNGSMHIDMFLYSNGSITQGQRVIVDASGGMTLKFSKQVEQVIIQFQGAQACYITGCKGAVYEIGGPAGIILSQNETSPGISPITDIGPTTFPISLGIGANATFGGYPIFWPSAGTYYPLMTFSFWNGSDSQAYALQSMPVYVAPTSQGMSLTDIVSFVVLGVGVAIATYVGLYFQIQDRRRGRAHVRNPRPSRMSKAVASRTRMTNSVNCLSLSRSSSLFRSLNLLTSSSSNRSRLS